jgi:hypothetical protein
MRVDQSEQNDAAHFCLMSLNVQKCPSFQSQSVGHRPLIGKRGDLMSLNVTDCHTFTIAFGRPSITDGKVGDPRYRIATFWNG